MGTNGHNCSTTACALRYKPGQVPPQVRPSLHVLHSGEYYPLVFMNDFWLLKEKWVAVNETVSELNLTMVVAPISMVKWQASSPAMHTSVKQSNRQTGKQANSQSNICPE
eukprot:1195410-Prorocentrum_minimum.AAC.9